MIPNDPWVQAELLARAERSDPAGAMNRETTDGGIDRSTKADAHELELTEALSDDVLEDEKAD